MSRKTTAPTLLSTMMLAADPHIQTARRVGSFVPAQADYTDYPEGKSVRVALPSGTLALMKLSCKPLGKVRKNQVLNVGSTAFSVKRVALASLVLRLEARL